MKIPRTIMRLLSLLLILALTLPLAACGKEENKPAETSAGTAADQQTDGTAETGPAETEALHDDLPDNLDFGGASFTYLSRITGYLHSDMNIEEVTGDILNDALYNRNRAVEQRLNILFDQRMSQGFGAQNNDARTAVMSDDHTYDVFFCEDYPTLSLAMDGYILDFKSLPYIDLTKGYWSQSINPSLSIHNKLFFAYSDSNLTPSDYTHALLFNKSMATDYNLPNLYDLVSTGKWTYDTYAEACEKVLSDLDGNGTMDDNDRFGLLSGYTRILPCFWISGGAQAIKKDANDEPYFNLSSDELFINRIERIFGMTYDNGTWFHNGRGNSSDDEGAMYNLFASGHSLFIDTTLFNIQGFRDMDQEFGILPFPKYDEAQKSYYTRVEGGCVPGVPVTAGDQLDKIGAVLEAWASESHDTVIPAFFEVSLKGKTARDNDSEAMLDLIYNTRTYDLGDTYWCELLRDGIFLEIFTNNQRDFASQMAANESRIKENIQGIIDAFDRLGD